MNTTLETMRRIRDVHGLNMTCGASNVSFGMPDRHTLGAAFLPMAMTAGLTSAIMDTRTPQIVDGREGRRPAARPRRLGRQLDRRTPQEAGRHHRMNEHPTGQPPDFEVDALRREGLIDPPDGPGWQPHDGSGRVQLSFSPSGRDVRVPPGVSVFDAASWNGIAIDSTCGGHGTCKKCKIQVARRRRRRCTASTCAPSPPTSSPTGWRLACLAQATTDLQGRRAAADHPAQGRHPRGRAPGDPAAGAAEAVRRARASRPCRTSAPTCSGSTTRSTTSSSPRTCYALRRLPAVLRQADYKVTAVIVDEALVDVEPGDTTATGGSRSRSTSAPPRWSRRCSTPRPAPRPRWPRCSTSSSRSAAT